MTRRVLLFVGLLLAGCAWHHSDPVYNTEANFARDERECRQVAKASMRSWDYFDVFSGLNYVEGCLKSRGWKTWWLRE